MSKYKYILSSLLVVVMAMCLTACGDDKDEPEAQYKANGRGVCVSWDGYTEDFYFYLSSDKVIMVSNQEEDWELRPYPNSFYKPLTNSNIYQFVKEALEYHYDIYPDNPINVVVNANTNWNEFPYSEISGLVDEMKVLQNKYKYITYDGEGGFYVFNRIEGRPFFQY
ncbi:hypothetical protein [Phocaeicola massiliensis]|uniref:hypothetical protein n=1 Tax=Phocaeicola massiliensis TaxID=204516 RepID=UPI0032BF94A6